MSTVRIQVRRGVAADWTSVNPILAAGEMGYESDTNKFKFGNGTGAWSTLSYGASDTPGVTEIAQDAINTALAVGTGLTKTYNDGANTITIALEDTVWANRAYVDAAVSSLGNTVDTTYVPESDKGLAFGVASLDSAAKVPTAQISDSSVRGKLSVSGDGIAYSSSTGVISLDLTDAATAVASKGYVNTQVSNIINGAPGALNTLLELSTALGSDANFSTTVTNSLATKATIASPIFTGIVTIPAGALISGYDLQADRESAITGATTAAATDATTKVAAEAALRVSGDAANAAAITAAETAAAADATVKANAAQTAAAADASTKANAAQAAAAADATTKANAAKSGAETTAAADASAKANTAQDLAAADATTKANAAQAAAISAAAADASTKSSDAQAAAIAAAATDATGKAAGAVTTAAADATAKADAAQAAAIAAAATAAGNALSSHESDTTNVHGISDTSLLALKSEVAAVTKTTLGLGSVDNTADNSKPVSSAQAAAIATAKSEAIADATARVNAVIAAAPAALDTLDELAAALGDDANYATTVTTALAGKVPSATPISQKTASYTLSSINEKDSMIEMNSPEPTTVTIPTDAAVAFPIGTSLDVLRVGAGAVTVEEGAGVTVNATPGRKLRAQWSSATLIKRAANTWVLVGDLSA